jgi:hypothetical protein
MCCIFLAAIDQVCVSELPLLRIDIDLVDLQTIVATALPVIIGQLGGGKNYSWVGRCAKFPPSPVSLFPLPLHLSRLILTRRASAYLLSAATLSTFYGKLSDLVGLSFLHDSDITYTHLRAYSSVP